MAVNIFIVGRLKAQNSTGRASSQGQAKLGKTAATTPTVHRHPGPPLVLGGVDTGFQVGCAFEVGEATPFSVRRDAGRSPTQDPCPGRRAARQGIRPNTISVAVRARSFRDEARLCKPARRILIPGSSRLSRSVRRCRRSPQNRPFTRVACVAWEKRSTRRTCGRRRSAPFGPRSDRPSPFPKEAKPPASSLPPDLP